MLLRNLILSTTPNRIVLNKEGNGKAGERAKFKILINGKYGKTNKEGKEKKY